MELQLLLLPLMVRLFVISSNQSWSLPVFLSVRLAGGWGSTDEQVGGAVQMSRWVGQYRLAGGWGSTD